MYLSFLQNLAVRFCSAGRDLFSALGRWIKGRPRLAAWVYPRYNEQADYRRHNGHMFADLHEHERMLADRPRMDFYAAAINRYVRPGARVIDLGTGTGILAALAARNGAGHVYAIDHSDILDQARTVAFANRLENVDFVSVHSTEFETDEYVDVILHEQMGDGLFDEEMVANVTDLRDRLLKEDGLILPGEFDFFCEPVMIRDDRVVPFIWELKVHGYDYSSLRTEKPDDPGYYRIASGDTDFVDHFLCQPEPIFEINLQTVNEATMPDDVSFSRTVVQAGRLDGYAVFFKARAGADLTLSSDPTDCNRAPNWGFRILRSPQENYEVGDVIETRLTIGRWPDLDSWRWYSVRREGGVQTVREQPITGPWTDRS
jgi:protein arginine N-methyltransferase 1